MCVVRMLQESGSMMAHTDDAQIMCLLGSAEAQSFEWCNSVTHSIYRIYTDSGGKGGKCIQVPYVGAI